MKNFKKVIALVLAAVMMMAMSITAFAAPETGSATIKVTNISERDEKTALTVYQIASIDSKKNEIVVADWAKAAYNEKLLPNFDATELNNAFEKANPKPSVVKTAESVKGADVEFKGLAGGVYMIKAVGDKVQYNTMVAVAYTTDDNGNYVAETKAIEIKAKGATNILTKDSNDGLVRAGQTVKFTITSTVPYMANKQNREYKVFDKETNLSAPKNVELKVGNADAVKASFELVSEKNGSALYTMNLSNLITADDSNAGKTVVITYEATVVGVEGYVNQAYDSTFEFDSNGDPVNPPEVYGHPACIKFTKYAEDGVTILEGAEFEVNKGNEALYFVEKSVGVYHLADASTKGATKTLKATYGAVLLLGLDEGTYHFTETKAPKGYSINTAGEDVVIDGENYYSTTLIHVKELSEQQKKDLEKNAWMIDTKLSSLPFTGGMGTTIFTVFGVALMALASALYFATKKKASVN